MYLLIDSDSTGYSWLQQCIWGLNSVSGNTEPVDIVVFYTGRLPDMTSSQKCTYVDICRRCSVEYIDVTKYVQRDMYAVLHAMLVRIGMVLTGRPVFVLSRMPEFNTVFYNIQDQYCGEGFYIITDMQEIGQYKEQFYKYRYRESRNMVYPMILDQNVFISL